MQKNTVVNILFSRHVKEGFITLIIECNNALVKLTCSGLTKTKVSKILPTL